VGSIPYITLHRYMANSSALQREECGPSGEK
jgi:hypothetical protein